MWCGTMPHARKVVEGFSVNSRMSQYFISEAFRIARFNIQQFIVFSFFLPQLEAFDYKFKWTKTLEKVLQRMCSWKGSFCSKAFNIQTHNNRIDIPWLATKVQGSSGKAPMTLGWAECYADMTMQFQTRWSLEFLGKQTGDWLWGEQKQLTRLVSIAGGLTRWIMGRVQKG